MSFLNNKTESAQYNVALPITGANRETSGEKLYQVFVLESFKD